MKPIINVMDAQRQTVAAYTDVRSSYSTEQYKKFVDWIESLIAQHQAMMTQCTPAKLGDEQIRLKQLIALRSALVDPGGASTGFVCD